MQKLLANNNSSMDAMIPIILFFFIVSFNSFLLSVTAADTIAVNQTLKDGQTIVSAQETFELGFFSPGNTTRNRYLGIWYKRLAAGTVAWVANRETPIANNFGELTLHPDGILVLRDSSTNRTIWASDSFGAIRVPVARLFDNGNLMVANYDEDRLEDHYIWQSFDHPTNTFLPTVRFGRNLERGVVRNVTSWKSVDDPAPGPYMVYMDFNGFPQIFQKNGDVIQFRLGIWNGLGFTGMPSLRSNPIFSVRYVSNEIETFSDFHLNNASVLSRLSLSPLGDMSWWNWINRTQGWFLYLTPTVDNCVRYGLCGVYGSCDIEQSPSCECLKGFTPKRRDQWDVSDWTEGCDREIPLDCVAGDGFRKYSNLKLPDTRRSWFDRKMTLEQCEMKCRNECNCTAYTTLDIKDNIGCLLWYDELIDMRKFPNNGQDIYLRMAAAELEKDRRTSIKKTPLQVILIPLAVGITILLGLCVLIIKKMRKQKPKAQETVHYQIEQNDFIDLPLFSLSKLLNATNNFSSSNKLGEGGFGPVYKGVLNDGLEIAVKRLSTNSSQGVEEFKNEVLFISRLQHRNLVRILGCCVEGQERMLIYEYMPNKGLDLFLFDETQSKILDWSQRFQIINGIARGLLYLHQDSRLRIIHRDLKAANILLDHDMNPKISDFGLARSFGGHETETNTRRVVGTYGYMSPEYAGDGIFSVKSDIFSFGVLVLEIVSGKKNRGFLHEDHNHNLLGHAWRLHREGKTLELADPYVVESGQTFEVLLCIHVGLLRVQHNPGDRPNMSTVVMMLSGDGQLPEPKEPGFYAHDDRFGPENSSSMQSQHSNNGLTVTLLDPR